MAKKEMDFLDDSEEIETLDQAKKRIEKEIKEGSNVITHSELKDELDIFDLSDKEFQEIVSYMKSKKIEVIDDSKSSGLDDLDDIDPSDI